MDELDVPDPELGTATIVFETPNGEVDHLTVENEYVVYFQDHWQVKAGEDGAGNDVVRRIPKEKVYYVERSVEEFQDRIDALLDRAKDRFDLDSLNLG
ncbi:hypothetical protein [Halalkalicoccus jeotgali]|uniref:Uncharacterized protein n=1 Tax=Halalkalicoccus jeotgali (strain DSM 18796 / CECT 7217 / JCM 14584 / KCTC 4019 / B3) TaxID=795797 RepID=D8J4X1_HALJB|nr:hypothetical protein [Halalkalicoccus jeotgali]ADJ15588.1 hypothetical protein HacjB3_11025 [Halalkalicoccus jeotgali B3]ELY36334.1 hypothetical protein C497_11638 [Halalkalicoccus jeotgali B3]